MRSLATTLLKSSFVAVPLALGPFFLDAETSKVAAAAAVGVIGFAAAAASAARRGLSSRIDAPLAAFAVVAWVSAIASVDGDLSWFGDRRELVFSLQGLAGCLTAYYLGCASGFDQKSGLADWAIAGALPVGVVALIEAAVSSATRIGATLGSPVYLGAYCAVTAPLAVHAAFDAERPKRSRLIARIACLLLLPALALSGSRGSWLGAGVGVSVVLLTYRPRALRRILVPGIAGLMIALFVFGAIGRHSRSKATSASDNLRLGAWRCALEAWKEHPLLGSGIGTFVYDYARFKGPVLARFGSQDGYARNAHNDVLEILATMGSAGVAALLWLYAAAVRGWLRARRIDPGGAAAIGGALAAAVILAKFNPAGFSAVWLSAALAGSLFAVPLGAAPRRAFPTAFVLFSLAVSWFSASVCLRAGADRQDLLGRRERAFGRPRDAALHFEAALRLRPGMAAYAGDWANLLWDSARSADGHDRAALLSEAVEVCVSALRRRPLDPQLHRLLALAEIERGEAGDSSRFDYARRALQNAESLDPDFYDFLGLRTRIPPTAGYPCRGLRRSRRDARGEVLIPNTE